MSIGMMIFIGVWVVISIIVIHYHRIVEREERKKRDRGK